MSSHHLRIVISIALSYLLVVLLCIPFPSRTKASLFDAPAPSLQAQNVPHREGELIVRFRGGISQRDKETILARHDVRKTIWDGHQLLDRANRKATNLSPYIEDIQILADGTGRMRLLKYFTERERGPDLLTSDYGFRWYLKK